MYRKKIYPLLHILENCNSAKPLCSSVKRDMHYFFRNREEDVCYYRITFSGNYIRGYRTRYLNEEGIGINTFTGIMIPAFIHQKGPEKLPYEEKTLLLKKPFNKYKDFMREFVNLTQDLDWDDDILMEIK